MISNLSVDINTLLKLPLERFKRVKPNVWNCRCPICGDSKDRKYITRFYAYVKKGSLNVCCHNCGYSRSFYNFMREKRPADFDAYRREVIMSLGKRQDTIKKEGVSVTKEESVEVSDDTFVDLLKFAPYVQICSDLPDNHPAYQYLVNRGFNQKQLSDLWYAENFFTVAALLDTSLNDKDQYQKDMMSKPRIIIPFISEDCRSLEMLQGRSLDPKDKLRYISIKANEDVDKVFGKHQIDFSKKVRVVEGPFDSMFIKNCVASCDANLTRIEGDVYIWDNQPRNAEVISYMESAIDNGKSIVIWPTSPKKKQDVNDMILSGVSRELLNTIIEMRTFKGLQAKMELSKWKRI